MGTETAHGKFNFPSPDLPTQKRTLVVTGDSWIVAEVAGGGVNTAARGVFRVLNSLLGNYFEFINLAGVGGERLDQIQARFTSDVLAYNPAYVGIIGGENDISADRTAAQMFASTKIMIDLAIDQGCIPLVLPCQATEAGWGAVSAASVIARIKEWSLYNRALLNYSMQKSGWIYLSKAFDGITDQSFTTSVGEYAPAILPAYSFDTGHANESGALRIAKDIHGQINGLFAFPDMLPRHDKDKGAGCHNPMQKITGTDNAAGILDATVTGTIPQGWYAVRSGTTGTSVASQVARTDVAGAFWNQFVCTGYGTGTKLSTREMGSTLWVYDYHLLPDYDLAVGDIVEFYFEVKISGVSDGAGGNGELNGLQAIVYILDSSTSVVSTLTANVNSGSTSKVLVASDLDGSTRVLSTVRHTLAANSYKWRVEIEAPVQAGATGTTDFTFSVGRVGVRKIA